MATYRDTPLEPKRHEGTCSCELLRKYGRLEKGAADPGCPFHGVGTDTVPSREGEGGEEGGGAGGVDVGDLDKDSTTPAAITPGPEVRDNQEDDSELGIGIDIDGFGAM